MKLKSILPGVFILLVMYVKAQERFPGGVPGAEAWYIVNHDELDQSIHKNHARLPVRITACPGTTLGKSLFNFNHAIASENLCLQYNAPLENTTSRNIFFVGRPKNMPDDISHVTTRANNSMEGLPPVMNRFDLALKSSYIDKLLSQYSSNNNANINFYNWNIYHPDRKFKSYGYVGETTFYIGAKFINSEVNPTISAIDFVGDFPEYISYPYELSANERGRVESYLALKYGITLADAGLSYRNSKNLVFWNSANNTIFGKRVFGIGRDDLSALNQLESESTHYTDYLIASVEKLFETNLEKQEYASIENNEFIVFADNGGTESLDPVNDFNVKTLNRKWLSQSTGEKSDLTDMFFKLNINGVIESALNEDPTLKLWMLHDKYVTNQNVSDFNSQYVEYYDPVNMDADYAYFEEVYFDPDKNVYDQYTFGVGPQIIVQIRLDTDCTAEKPKATMVITGGKAPYDFKIYDSNGLFKNGTITDNTLQFETYPPETYTAYVMDSNGNEANVEVNVVHYQLQVDLGPDITLNASLPQVTLDAGVNVTDPDATYQWYHNDVLLNYYAATLTVDEPGEYRVIVTSGNHSCQVEDRINVIFNFSGTVLSSENSCDNIDGTITLTLAGGIPPFTTVISKPTLTISQVHTTETTIFPNMEFGEYTVTTIDSEGNEFHGTAVLEGPLEGIGDPAVIPQLQDICQQLTFGQPDYFSFACAIDLDLELDASLNVTNPNVSYEWFMNGSSMNIYSPFVKLIQDQNAFQGVPIWDIDETAGGNEFTIKITNLNTGCSSTETFYLFRNWGVVESEGTGHTQPRISQTPDSNAGADSSYLTSKVYPNPTESGMTFYYEISSSKVFQGTVEIYTPSGAILQQVPVSGNSSYKLPLSLTTAGVYFICTKTEGKVLTDKVIIR